MKIIDQSFTETQKLLYEIMELGIPRDILQDLLTLYFGASQEELVVWFYGDEAPEDVMDTLKGIRNILIRYPDKDKAAKFITRFVHRLQDEYHWRGYHGHENPPLSAYHEIRG